MAPSKPISLGVCAGFIAFTFCWCGLILAFDWFALHGAVRQWQALDYPTTTGTVISSKAVSSGRSIYSRAIESNITTQFSVDGKSYETKNWRYEDMTIGLFGQARRIVKRHPIGSHPLVYYPPENPQDAILEPGITGYDSQMLLLLTPLNLMGFLCIAGSLWLVRQWKKQQGSHASEGTDQSIRNLRLGLPSTLSYAALVLVLGPLAFGFLLMASDLGGISFWGPFYWWLVIIVISALLCLHGYIRSKSDVYRLVIDRIAGTATHPAFGLKKKIYLRNLIAADVITKNINNPGTASWFVRLTLQKNRTYEVRVDSEPVAQAAAHELRLAAGLPDAPPAF